MKTNDVRQIVNERKKKRRTHEENFHQIISDEVKAIMKFVLNKKQT
jgi:glutamyl-tRNA reductase